MSSCSFYKNKNASIKQKISEFERKKMRDERSKMVVSIFRLRQRKVKKKDILDMFDISEYTYAKLLKEGEQEYAKLRG